MISEATPSGAHHSDAGAGMEVDEGESMETGQVAHRGSEGGSACETLEATKEVEDSDSMRFSPPVYIQRYCRVSDVIEKLLETPKYKSMNVGTGKTIMEVGCAEFGMMKYFKSFVDVGKIIFVDVDKDLLESKSNLLRPLPGEYLQRISRPQPLTVEAYAGCVTKVDAGLRRMNPDIWAVVGIEIIEHLHPTVLRGFEETVFGITRPHIVIVTTPNSEFNVAFNLPPGKFRHWDHKFEWSRGEFQRWCDKIVEEFPCYTYTTEGVGDGPEETRHLGSVSQMAVFEKVDNVSHVQSPPYSLRIQEECYSLIRSVEYPNYIETRTTDQIIVNEFRYHVNSYLFSKSMQSYYEEGEMTVLKVSMFDIQNLPGMPTAVLDGVFLRNVLENAGYEVLKENGTWSVFFDIPKYIDVLESNNDDDSSSADARDEEQDLCEGMDGLDVNKVVTQDEEWWE